MEEKIKEIVAGLRKTSEYNKLGGLGHGDLEDAFYICGISPETLAQAIQQLLLLVNEIRDGRDWKPFNDAFEAEIEAQEFMIDEGEWLAIIKALKVAQEAMEK